MLKNLLRLTFFSSLLLVGTSLAGRVAVVDTGVDYLHNHLKKNMSAYSEYQNGRDDDHNGYPDDRYGWNVVDQNSKIFHRSHIRPIDSDIFKYKEILAKKKLGTITEAELQWFDAKKEDKEFRRELSVFNNYAHGTHVAGIIKNQDSEVKITPIRYLDLKSYDVPEPTEWGNLRSGRVQSFTAGKKSLKNRADMYLKRFRDVLKYLRTREIDVVNGSYGSSWKGAVSKAKNTIRKVYGLNPHNEDMEALARYYLTYLMKQGEKIIAAHSQWLFVFSAGNSGSDNDVFPHYPSDIRLPNVIAVAALNGKHLAEFTNYGLETVDVAFAGTAISSSVPVRSKPYDKFLPASGTSMAAPGVAGLASKLKSINSELEAADLKEVICKTTYKTSLLSRKLACGGRVSVKRAVKAAEYSRYYTLKTSIAKAIKLIPNDQKSSNLKSQIIGEVWNLPEG